MQRQANEIEAQLRRLAAIREGREEEELPSLEAQLQRAAALGPGEEEEGEGQVPSLQERRAAIQRQEAEIEALEQRAAAIAATAAVPVSVPVPAAVGALRRSRSQGGTAAARSASTTARQREQLIRDLVVIQWERVHGLSNASRGQIDKSRILAKIIPSLPEYALSAETLMSTPPEQVVDRVVQYALDNEAQSAQKLAGVDRPAFARLRVDELVRLAVLSLTCTERSFYAALAFIKRVMESEYIGSGQFSDSDLTEIRRAVERMLLSEMRRYSDEMTAEEQAQNGRIYRYALVLASGLVSQAQRQKGGTALALDRADYSAILDSLQTTLVTLHRFCASGAATATAGLAAVGEEEAEAVPEEEGERGESGEVRTRSSGG